MRVYLEMLSEMRLHGAEYQQATRAAKRYAEMQELEKFVKGEMTKGETKC
jgi:hypothetical protein